MTRAMAAQVLLLLGVLAELVCVAGVLWMRDVFDRLHFAAAGTTVGPVLVAAAVVLAGLSTTSALVQCLTALMVLLVMNPLQTHVTARALRRRTPRARSGLDRP